MEDVSRFEVTRQTNQLGKLEWVGKSPYVRMSYDLLWDLGYKDREYPKKAQVGPYRLLFVEYEPCLGDFALYVRQDRLGALRVFLYRATRWLDLVYRRLIITLAVWNMAEYHAGYIPSWRDIRLKGRKR